MRWTAPDDLAIMDRAASSDPRATAGAWSIRNRTILVATNGSPESSAAIRVASDLAHACDARPTVVQAYYPGPAWIPPLPPAGLAPDPATLTRENAYEQLRRAVPEAVNWPVRVVVGEAEDVIVSKARAMDAALILMGLHKGNPLQRAFGTELLLQVIRRSTCPVLATTASMHEIPARVVVGLDIDMPSARAVQVAAALAAHGAMLDLVFVDVPHHRATDSLLDKEGHAKHVADAFQHLREQLTTRTDLKVRTTVLTGVTGDALRAFAMNNDADVVVLGTGQHRFMERLLFGSITARLLHEERWSVLAVPPE